MIRTLNAKMGRSLSNQAEILLSILFCVSYIAVWLQTILGLLMIIRNFSIGFSPVRTRERKTSFAHGYIRYPGLVIAVSWTCEFAASPNVDNPGLPRGLFLWKSPKDASLRFQIEK